MLIGHDMRSWCAGVAALMLGVAHLASAQEPGAEGTHRLEEERVVGERPGQPFLPAVQGTSIYAGKKTTVTELEELPVVVNENYRQLLYRTPGLLVSEETTPLVSIGYRGLDPNRAQFMQILKDGIPVQADILGYPEAYYTPPFAMIESTEFVRGGAALLYGPQPGGALNFVTRKPPMDRQLTARTEHTFGSYDFYSTYNSLAGTVGRTGYSLDFYRRQGDGFRDANSDFEQNSGSAKLLLDADSDSRWTLNFDGYSEEHGEPGGLAADPGPNAVTFSEDRNATTRQFDLFRLQRFVPWLRWEREFSPQTQTQLTTWGGYYSRYSQRQRGGKFGTVPTGPDAQTNTIELQEFYTFGIEGRARHDWELMGETQTLSAGVMYYRGASPRRDRRGTTPDASDGAERLRSDRLSDYLSLFAEQRFTYGDFSITPGVRLENIWQSVKERVNVDKSSKGVPLSSQANYDFEPLFGIGLAYTVLPDIEAYGNVSSAYRPKLFTQAISSVPEQVVANDINDGKSWQYEVGFRGDPTPWVYWDTSLFFLDFTDQIGTVSQGGLTIIDNVGHSQHKGWDAAAEADVIGLIDAVRDSSLATRFGSLSLYGTVMLLDAEFVGGPLKGNTPQYAPDDYLVRTGLRYNWHDRFKAGFLGSIVDNSFGDDNNSSERVIPSYHVWDLTFEGDIYRDTVALYFGVNNLFDENYFSRVTGTGIDPAYLRNFYGGFRVTL